MRTRAKKGRTLLSPEQSHERDAKLIADFDSSHPVGSNVWYWTSLPFGPVRETTVRRSACIMPSGEPVCFVDGVSGCVSIWHISAVDESRRSQINFVQPE